MYIKDSWGMVSLPAVDVQAMVETIIDVIARLTSDAEHDAEEAIADELAMALDLLLGIEDVPYWEDGNGEV